MNDRPNQSNSADESYRKIFETLNASQEGQAFLSTFLKKHRKDQASQKTFLSSAGSGTTGPRLVTDNTASPADLKSPGTRTGKNRQDQTDRLLTPSHAFPHLKGKTETNSGQASLNPVLFALRELASNLKKTEEENKKAQRISTDIRKLAELLDKQDVPSPAGKLLRVQAEELDKLVKSRQQSSWQIARVVQVLQILENYVRQESVANSS